MKLSGEKATGETKESAAWNLLDLDVIAIEALSKSGCGIRTRVIHASCQLEKKAGSM
jgi:hypothetical protein